MTKPFGYHGGPQGQHRSAVYGDKHYWVHGPIFVTSAYCTHLLRTRSSGILASRSPRRRANGRQTEAASFLVSKPSTDRHPVQTQLSHQTQKYDSKSEHYRAPNGLGTTHAKASDGLSEVLERKNDGWALISYVQQCELPSLSANASTSVSSRSIRSVPAEGINF
jgi:hypothetical protein